MQKIFVIIFMVALSSSIVRAEDISGQLATYAQHLPQLRARATAGDANFQNILGGLYERGVGVAKDEKEALRWFQLAANQGSASAQANLGRMYSLGRGVPVDDREAAKWWNMAAGNGNPNAQLVMGQLEIAGKGVDPNPLDAHFWLSLASRDSDPRIEQEAQLAFERLRGHVNFAEMQKNEQRVKGWHPGMQLPLRQSAAVGASLSQTAINGQSSKSVQTLGDTDACAIYRSSPGSAYSSCVSSKH